jgi:hypothetical protein
MPRPVNLVEKNGSKTCSEHLVGDLRGVLGGGADAVEALLEGGVRGLIRLDQAAVSEDHREQVVEVVGDAALVYAGHAQTGPPDRAAVR